MPPVIPDEKASDRGYLEHGGDRGSPAARVLSASPNPPPSQYTPASEDEALELFSKFVSRSTEGLLRYARSGGTDWHLAEDFVQISRERVWDQWVHTGVLITSFAYSRVIVNRVKIDYYRVAKNTRAIPTDLSAEIPLADTADNESALMFTEAFRREVARLPPRVRQVMELTLYRQLDVPEIAGLLKLNSRTVSNYRSIGKDRLVTAFRGKQEE